MQGCGWLGAYSGDMVYRASATLFNPNLFGFWASLIYVGYSYGLHYFKEHRNIMLLGMVLSSVAIYLTGSRSAAYILFAMLFISTPLLKERLSWMPLLILPLTMLLIYVGVKFIISPYSSASESWHHISLLAERFISTPFYVINYMLSLLGLSNGVFGEFFTGVPVEIKQSIGGRFYGSERDAGWVALYYDFGWFGLAAVLFSCLMALLKGVQCYLFDRSARSVYALVALCCCILMGVTMRFQLFPLWLFVGVVLVPCLVCWSKSARSNSPTFTK